MVNRVILFLSTYSTNKLLDVTHFTKQIQLYVFTTKTLSVFSYSLEVFLNIACVITRIELFSM